MSKVTVTLENGEEVVFDENTIGHQVGYGACQIMLDDGSQYVFNNFKDVAVIPSEEESKAFIEEQAKLKAIAEANVKAQEEAHAKHQASLAANDEEISGSDSAPEPTH